MKLIQQGAEAKILLNKDIITKDRIPKTYRHEQLDKKIRTRRTKSETKLLTKALEIGINTPKVLNPLKDGKFKALPTMQRLHKKSKINLEHIKGDRLSETLHTYPKKKQFKLMQNLGKQVALLHKNNIIHGDLTTSNTILQKKQDKLFIIDFGLGFISARLEDKAVDLHLIKQALEAKHFQNNESLFQHFLKGYKFPETKKVLEQLKKVESRGRYKH
tara:strand:+ start:757 stop:1407 length:651 start_codon:yes stop_codon:yes gene_type:complete